MQYPPQQSTRSLRAGRTNPALPTTPVYVPAAQRQRWPRLPTSKRQVPPGRALWQLALLGFLLSGCFVLLYPLLDTALPNAVAARDLPRALPWLGDLLWTRRWPGLVTLLARVPWLTSTVMGRANLALLVLGVAGLLLLLAVRVGQRALKYQSQRGPLRAGLGVVWLFAALFALLFVLLPGGLGQEALLSGLDGRLILVYHANPYLASASILARDPLYHALAPAGFVSPLAGPLWLDLAVLPAWLAQAHPLRLLLTLRAAGLLLHLGNTLLLWGILSRLKPEIRLTGTIFYAWNPIFLLLGIVEAPQHLATLFLLLLGAFLLQRRSLLLSWVCFVLAALINPLCLLLLPLLLRALARMLQGGRGRRALWWLSCLLSFALVVGLAYAPYWSGLGLPGIAQRLAAVFWQDGAQNSLLAALSKLPFVSWPPAAWLLTPHHWLLLPAVIAGGLLLLGIWITDNLELALLFGSWIFLVLLLFLPVNTPWLILLPLGLALASSSRRTALLAHLLSIGALLTYCLAYWPEHWDGLALVTIGLAALVWGWTLFFLSTWQMTHQEDDEPPVRKRLSISRPSWPSRPSAWPATRPGWRGRP